MHLASKGRKHLLRTPALLPLSVGVLGEVLPACRDGAGLPWHWGLFPPWDPGVMRGAQTGCLSLGGMKLDLFFSCLPPAVIQGDGKSGLQRALYINNGSNEYIFLCRTILLLPLLAAEGGWFLLAFSFPPS